MGEMRSPEPAGVDLLDEHPPLDPGMPLASTTLVRGVGARQADLFAPQGGGGYLDERNRSDLSKKDLEAAKIRELDDMGLSRLWLRVAATIGYDNFLQLWRLLDTAAEQRELRLSDNQSMIEVQLRRFSSFRRYQRNRFIETLAASGLPADQIRLEVKAQLGENLTRNHIVRLARRGRIPR